MKNKTTIEMYQRYGRRHVGYPAQVSNEKDSRGKAAWENFNNRVTNRVFKDLQVEHEMIPLGTVPAVLKTTVSKSYGNRV
jgi:hypothetical protein